MRPLSRRPRKRVDREARRTVGLFSRKGTDRKRREKERKIGEEGGSRTRDETSSPMAWLVVVCLPLPTDSPDPFPSFEQYFVSEILQATNCQLPANRSLSDKLNSVRYTYSLCRSKEFVKDLQLKRRLSLVRMVERIASRCLSRQVPIFPILRI